MGLGSSGGWVRISCISCGLCVLGRSKKVGPACVSVDFFAPL